MQAGSCRYLESESLVILNNAAIIGMKYLELQPCDIPHIVDDDDPDETIGIIK